MGAIWTPSTKSPASTTPSSTTPSSTTQDSTPAMQPTPGTAPVGGDAPVAAPPAANSRSTDSKDKPAPGTTPGGWRCPAPNVNPDKVIEPGSQKVNVKPGSIEDVSAVGNRDIGGRGIGNWYSTDSEIKMGKPYAMEVEKSTKFITIRWSPST